MEGRYRPESLTNPQETPSDHAYTVLQDFGPEMGGWGPAAIVLPWQSEPSIFVYTGDAPHVVEVLKQFVRKVAQDTGRPTKLVRYSVREDVFSVGGSS